MTKILIVDDMSGWREFHKLVVNDIFDNPEVVTAESAKEGYDKLLENNNTPFDIIITDLQMESDFEPKYAGEWFVEQIKTFKNYYKTKIIIVSASNGVNIIAERLGVDYIRKTTARNSPNAYDILK